ncbi:hypothetical protein ASG04_15800 [Curtobacterium sp. Leaf183]|uniref:hypothetical protein n=1 Tax=Curtobacterium sp. Leaf183 TaxID=1736291 RepID=UPI0006F90190|nr:hypothetical protein [Curtobacterium sp. Leaf183]KQS06039.1 hypothetical protein ASG04_15800 [Curtobacterium sp. Leaf183]
MGASNYLPPFDADERATASGNDTGADGGRRAPRAAGESSAVMTATDAEVTYADFLGDEVED